MMFVFDFRVISIRITLSMEVGQFGRENKKTKAKKSNNILDTSM